MFMTSTLRRDRRAFLTRGLQATAALASGAIPLRSFAQPAAGPTPPRAEPLVRAYMQQFDIPGMQVAFVRGNRTLYVGVFGVAERQPRVPVRADSLFRIASNSKAFTSAAIFLLVESGRIALTDRVFAPDGILRQYANLGAQRDWLHAITVHELLTHTAGGWSNESNDPMFEQPGMNHDQLIRWTLQTHRLQNAPGTHYAYSNFGYCVLGRVIEHVSGQPYAQFVHQNVMRPANITDMRIGVKQPARNEVRYYGQGGENPYGFPIARMDSHGGWIATAHDQARFLACLFSPQDNEGTPAVVSAESLRVMTTGTQANRGYACGLAVNTAGNAWHAGSLPGTMSLMVHTKSGMTWGAVCNTRPKADAAPNRLDDMLWQIARSVPEWRAG